MGTLGIKRTPSLMMPIMRRVLLDCPINQCRVTQVTKMLQEEMTPEMGAVVMVSHHMRRPAIGVDQDIRRPLMRFQYLSLCQLINEKRNH